MLDVMIRDGSDNAQSLDDVMRQLYQGTYKKGRGFTESDWWPAVTRAAGGRSFADFQMRYIDGREPYALDRILPMAGMRVVLDTLREPRLGIQSAADSSGIIVAGLIPGGAAQEAGVQVGDRLLALGDLSVDNPDFGEAFRSRYGKQDETPLPIKVRRGADTLTLNGTVKLAIRLERRIEADPAASAKAVRIRDAIFRGAKR
jgi:predicted metalloprotease with PDZ domain